MPQVTLQEAIRLSQELQQAGRWREAEDVFRQILAQKPDHAESWHQLGLLALQRRDHDTATDQFLRAIERDASRDFYHANLGNAYLARGQVEPAIRAFQSALRLKPDRAETHNNLGNAFLEADRVAQALEHLEQAARLLPQRAEFQINLGIALDKANRTEEALAAHQRAVVLRPDLAAAQTSLGSSLVRLARYDEAIACHERAIQIEPENADAHNNLAVALRNSGRVADSIAACQRALSLRPDFPEAHTNLAAALLVSGDFVRGWQEYRWRWRCKAFGARPHNFNQPEWDGGDLRGRVIFLHGEQGLGDTIQFVRFAPQVAARGARVVLGCPPALRGLLEVIEGIERVIAEGEKLPAFDCHATLLELPRLLGTTLDTIPAKVPYLAADPQKRSEWRQRMAAARRTPPGFSVGLVWAGRAEHSNDRNRSIPWQTFGALLRAASGGCEFFSLQVGNAARELTSRDVAVADLTGELHDFTDTAALIVNLDLVISVDTSVAHLAGALGRRAWVLLPFAPDFRWLLEREDSPWYPTLRLFRQTKPGDWAGVIQRVLEALENEPRAVLS